MANLARRQSDQAFRDPTFDSLTSGMYFDPELPLGPPAQRFRGSVGEFKTLVPRSALSPATTETQKFGRPRSTAGRVADPRKFRKGDLGEYEKADVIHPLRPSEEGLPPQKYNMAMAPWIGDLATGVAHGAGDELLGIAALPRKLAEMAPEGSALSQLGEYLPTREQVNRFAQGLERFAPLPPEIIARLKAGPYSTGGSNAGTFGNLLPYMAMGGVPAMRRFAAPIMGASLLD